MFVSAIVLAAGGSTRLGQPKQLLAFRGRTLLDAALDTARACAFDQIVVALGGAASEVRELHDALKRRCYYHWIEYPGVERAAAIVRRRVPGAAEPLVDAATSFVSSVRSLDLDKPPGLAEAIDWVAALHALGVSQVERPSALRTIGSLAKTPDDTEVVREALEGELSAARPER